MQYNNKIIRVQQQDNELMHLTWMINNICPNRCSYCPSDLHNGKNHHYDWENAKKFFEILFQRYPKIHCSVSGGEPSVSPFFKDIVKIFYKNNHTVGVTTNAAKPTSYWEEISQYLSYVCFSYHPEFPDKNFIEKVSATSKNTFVTARVMMHPAHWDHCVEIFKELSKIETIFVEPVRIFYWHGGSDMSASNYSLEQIEWFKQSATENRKQLLHLTNVKVPDITSIFYFDNNEKISSPNTVDLINAGLTNFSGYKCEVGIKELFINQEGYVYLGNCMIGGPVGNINDPDNIEWPVSPVTCNKNLCHCTTSVNINKWIEE